jgi:hypothetical protein
MRLQEQLHVVSEKSSGANKKAVQANGLDRLHTGSPVVLLNVSHPGPWLWLPVLAAKIKILLFALHGRGEVILPDRAELGP